MGILKGYHLILAALVTCILHLPAISSLQLQSVVLGHRPGSFTKCFSCLSANQGAQGPRRRVAYANTATMKYQGRHRFAMPLKILRGGSPEQARHRTLAVVRAALLVLSFSPSIAPVAAQAAAADVLVNCAGSASSFFMNMRVPAALVAGAALGNVWATIGDKDDPNQPKFQALYTLLVCLCVVLEFSTVFIATASDVKLMSGYYSSPMALNTITFLTREMEFAYLAVRLQFALGILSFLAAMAVRAFVTFPGNIGKAAALVFLGTGSSLLCMINISFWQFLMMHFRYAELFIKQFAFSNPMGGLAVLLAFGALYFLLCEVLASVPAKQLKKDEAVPDTS